MDSLSEIDKQILDLEERYEKATSEETKKAHRNLLIASGGGILIALTGAVPTEIPVMGINFKVLTVPRIAVLLLFMVVIAYFLFSFYVNEKQDRRRRKRRWQELERLRGLRREKLKELGDTERLLFWFRQTVSTSVSAAFARTRQFHEYGLPISVAVLSLLVLSATIVFVASSA